MKMLVFSINSQAMPPMRFAPERFENASSPAFNSAVSAILAEVVFPFVPVTMSVLTPRDVVSSTSGQILSASLPGSAVPPLFRSLKIPCVILQTTHATNANKLFNYSTVTDFARFLGLSISQPRSSAT